MQTGSIVYHYHSEFVCYLSLASACKTLPALMGPRDDEQKRCDASLGSPRTPQDQKLRKGNFGGFILRQTPKTTFLGQPACFNICGFRRRIS